MGRQALRLSGALFFHTVFSIGPLLIIVNAGSGLVFGATGGFGQLKDTFNVN